MSRPPFLPASGRINLMSVCVGLVIVLGAGTAALFVLAGVGVLAERGALAIGIPLHSIPGINYGPLVAYAYLGTGSIVAVGSFFGMLYLLVHRLSQIGTRVLGMLGGKKGGAK